MHGPSQMFEEMRKIKTIGVWPVGLLFENERGMLHPDWPEGPPRVERPLVRPWDDTTPPWHTTDGEQGEGELEVYGWETIEFFLSRPGYRRFNMDMASFAFRYEPY